MAEPVIPASIYEVAFLITSLINYVTHQYTNATQNYTNTTQHTQNKSWRGSAISDCSFSCYYCITFCLILCSSLLNLFSCSILSIDLQHSEADNIVGCALQFVFVFYVYQYVPVRTCPYVQKKKLSNNHTGRSFALVNDDWIGALCLSINAHKKSRNYSNTVSHHYPEVVRACTECSHAFHKLSLALK